MRISIVKLVILLVWFNLILSSTIVAQSATVIIDAGLLEWEEGNLSVTDGFVMSYEGKFVHGNSMYYDIQTGMYRLDEVGFVTCTKPIPHYKIYAKRLEIYHEDRLVFFDPQVQIGKLKIQLPVRLTLKYRDGAYQFPQWLPEVVYGKDGVGIKLHGEISGNQLDVSGVVLLKTSGIDGNIKGIYRPGFDIAISTDIRYVEEWATQFQFDWRENRIGPWISANWQVKNSERESQINLGYAKGGWKTGITLKQTGESVAIPTIKLETPNATVGGITSIMQISVIFLTENDKDIGHNVLYISNSMENSFNIKKSILKWNFTPTHVLVSGYGLAGYGMFNISTTTPINEDWMVKFGYGRTALWGSRMPQSIKEFQHLEYLSSQFYYTTKNLQREGWDINLDIQYNLLSRKLYKLQSHIVKLYDCFDLSLNADILAPSLTMGIQLKY